MEKSKSMMVWRSLLVLFFAFLWGGGIGAHAEKKAWVKYEDGTLTFQYGEKSSLGTDEYWLNEGSNTPGWNNKSDNVTKVVFAESFARARPTSCYVWFYLFDKLNTIEGIENLNTSNVTSMAFMFDGCSGLTSLDVSKFNTSKVTSMFCMFYKCKGLTSLDVSKFNTSNVTSMGYMFRYCSGLTSLDVSKFNTSNVTSMGYMFNGCSGLTSLNVSNFNTSNVTDMRYMFNGCSVLTSLNVSNFNTSKVTNMCYMFTDCSSLTSLNVSNFNTSKVTNMCYMFTDCSSLTSLDLSNFNTSNVKDMSYMFYNCKGLTSLDVSKFNTSNVTDMMYMFYDCKGLTSLDVSNFNTSNVTNIRSMFDGCSGLTSLDLSNFNTSNVTDMEHMFYGCSNMETIYASDKFVTTGVTSDNNGGNLFTGCKKLVGDIVYDATKHSKSYATVDGGYFIDKQYIRPWVKYADGTLTFQYGYKKTLGTDEYLLNKGVTPTSWENKSKLVTKVVFDNSFAQARPTTCYNWFRNFWNLTTIDGIANLNTSNVGIMTFMFSNCSQLTSLDLSNFNTSNVTDVGYMFKGCTKLSAIYYGDKFDVDKLSNMNNEYMLTNCPAILYCSPLKYKSFKSSSVIASFGNAVKTYVGINKKSEYGTLCVPVGSSLAEGSFTGFDKLYTVTNADKDKGTITMVEAKSIEPGVPYVYHRYLEGVDFDGDNNMSVITFDVDENASAAVTAPKNENSLLKGTFESIVAVGGSYILQTDGNFHPVAEDNKTLQVGAYRAYLDLGSTEIGGGDEGFGDAKAYRIVFEDGEATGIDRINGSENGVYDQADQQPKAYFDLMGRKVNAPQKGEIYIVNGKKIVYKN